MTVHLDIDVLEQYSMHESSDVLTASVEEHLLVCASCQEQLSELELLNTALKHALVATERLPISRRSAVNALFGTRASWWKPALVAGLIALVVLITPYNGRRGGPQDLHLVATRGSSELHASPGTVQVYLDISQLPYADVYQMQLVNSAGEQIWWVERRPQDGTLSAVITDVVHAGRYWMRVYAKGELVREYQLAVK